MFGHKNSVAKEPKDTLDDSLNMVDILEKIEHSPDKGSVLKKKKKKKKKAKL